MTTFTLQDLTPAQQEAVKQHEAMLSAYSILNTRSINNLPTTTEEEFMEHGMNNPISANLMNEETLINMGKALANHEIAHQQAQQARLDAVPQQPSQVNPEALIDEMVAQLSISLKLLLTTLVNQPQPKAEPEVGTNVPSLQETLELTLQQADGFKEMVAQHVAERVESEVEMYFERRFDPTDHFDFNDAVTNEVNDRIDDVVRDQLDDVVADKLDEVVTEKLENASVSISF